MNGTVTLGGRYVLQEVVGTGGMAVVYRATDLRHHCDVAVKVLRRELMSDPAFIKRFEHEAHAVSHLDHPNIIKMIDIGHDGDVRYIVIEYVPGYTLKQFIAQRGHVAPQEAINITLEVLAAVNHAHKHHIIHRDLKPQNILLTDSGTVKVSDFGKRIPAIPSIPAKCWARCTTYRPNRLAASRQTNRAICIRSRSCCMRW